MALPGVLRSQGEAVRLLQSWDDEMLSRWVYHRLLSSTWEDCHEENVRHDSFGLTGHVNLLKQLQGNYLNLEWTQKVSMHAFFNLEISWTKIQKKHDFCWCRAKSIQLLYIPRPRVCHFPLHGIKWYLQQPIPRVQICFGNIWKGNPEI